jgi:hypothetical protein
VAVYPSVRQARNGNVPTAGEQHQGGEAAQAVKAWYAAQVQAALAAPGQHRQAPEGGAK